MAKQVSDPFHSLLAEINAGKFKPIYLLMGTEAWYIDKIVDALENNVVPEEERDFNQSIFYGADADLKQVVSVARQFPVMAERRLVILKEAQSMHNAKKALDSLATYIQHHSASTVLVISFKGETLAATSELMKVAGKSDDTVIYKSSSPMPWQLAEPIREYLAPRKATIDADAIDLIAETAGTSLSVIFGELDKIFIAHPEGVSRINAHMVAESIGMSKEFMPYELTKAIAVRDYAKCMIMADAYERNPKQYPLQPIASTLFNWFSKLVIAWLTRDQSDAALMKATGAKTPAALRDLRTGMRGFDLNRAVGAIHAIRQFDCQSKGIGSTRKAPELFKELIFRIFTL